MKRAMALLLAVATMAATAVTAFASAPKAQDGLSFDRVDNTELQNGLLTPGQTYKFPILITTEGETRPMTQEDLEKHTLRLESISGKDALNSAKLVTIGGKQYFELQVKAGWPANQTEVEYRLRYLSKTDGKVVHSLDVTFATGYATASDGSISALQEGDFIQVDMDRPVYTKAQLEKIARLNGYGKVTFAAGDWQYTVNVSDMDGINLLANHNAVQDILDKFSSHDFKFVTFPAGSQFKGSGSLAVDVSDVSEDFEGKFFVYRYLNGKLTKESFTYNQEDDTLVIPTNKLGRFVITDKEIADGTVIFGQGTGNSGSNSNGSNSGTKPNPDTGASNNMAMALGLLAAAAVIGVVAVKKH